VPLSGRESGRLQRRDPSGPGESLTANPKPGKPPKRLAFALSPAASGAFLAAHGFPDQRDVSLFFPCYREKNRENRTPFAPDSARKELLFHMIETNS
jgi:hypothetical protein